MEAVVGFRCNLEVGQLLFQVVCPKLPEEVVVFKSLADQARCTITWRLYAILDYPHPPDAHMLKALYRPSRFKALSSETKPTL